MRSAVGSTAVPLDVKLTDTIAHDSGYKSWTTPNKSRFYSMSRDVRSEISPLNDQWEENSYGIARLPGIPQNPIKLTALSRMDGRESVGENRVVSHDSVMKELDSDEFSLPEEWVPIVINNEMRVVNGAKSYGSGEHVWEFIHIKEMQHSTATQGDVVVDIFVHDKDHQSEPVRYIDNGQLHNVFEIDNRRMRDVILPYLKKSGMPKLVFVMYFPSECDFGRRVVGAGWLNLREAIKRKGLIQVDLQVANVHGGKPLSELFNAQPKPTGMWMKVEVEQVTEVDQEKTAWVTASDHDHPSQLLSVVGLTLNLKRRMDTTKYCMLSMSMKRCNREGKIEAVNNSRCFGSDRKCAYSSSVRMGPTMVFPDQLMFLMDPIYDPTITLHIKVIRGKKTVVFKDVVELTDIEAKNGEYKKEISGATLTFNCRFASAVKDPPDLTVNKELRWRYVAYKLQRYLNPANSNEWSLETLLSDLTPYVDAQFETFLLEWIDSFFGYTDKAFLPMFIDFLIKSGLGNMACITHLLFHILGKAILSQGSFDVETMSQFLKECAVTADSIPEQAQDTFVTAVCKLLQQMGYVVNPFSAPYVVQGLVHTFVWSLNLGNRLKAFNALFLDIVMILAICNHPLPRRLSEIPVSPYTPLTSLFLSTVFQGLKSHEKTHISGIVAVIVVLGTSLELYSNKTTAAVVAKALFPLFSIIQTLFCAFSVENRHKLVPILLFFIKNCEHGQFSCYWNMLVYDMQLRFTDILRFLVNEVQQKEVPQLLNGFRKAGKMYYVHHVTLRIIKFLGFYSKLNPAKTERDVVESLIGFLDGLLHLEAQTEGALPCVLKAMAFFIRRHTDFVFKEECDLVHSVIAGLVSLTYTKSAFVREHTIDLLIWLGNQEKKVTQSMERCSLILTSCVCTAYLEDTAFKPFFDRFPNELKAVSATYSELEKAVEQCDVVSITISRLLEFRDKYKNFLALRTAIYNKIVSIQERPDVQNYVCAFIGQWRLCAVIAEGLKLQGHSMLSLGLPPSGMIGFPFMADEPSVDLNAFSKKPQNRWISLKSPMLSADYLANATVKAVRQVRKAGMEWAIDDVAIIVFDLWEKRHDLQHTQKILKTIAKIYQARQLSQMDGTEQTQRQFHFVRLRTDRVVDERFNKGVIALIGVGQVNEDLTVKREKCAESMKRGDEHVSVSDVSYRSEDMAKMAVSSFFVDEVVNPTAKWTETYVCRSTYKTQSAVPSATTWSGITDESTTKVSRYDYYTTKLNEFYAKYRLIMESLVAAPMHAEIGPALRMMELIVMATNESPAYYTLVLMRGTRKSLVETSEPPTDLLQLADNIWACLSESMANITFSQKKKNTTEANKLSLAQCQKIFAMDEWF